MSTSICKLTVLVFLFYLFPACGQSASEKNAVGLPLEYINGSAALTEGGLVRVRLDVLNEKKDAAVLYFASCVAARYAINGGFAFVSNDASTIGYKSNLILVEADYLILSDLKSGSKKLEAEVVAIN